MTWMSWASSQEIKNNHFTSSCVISGAEFPELKRRKRQRGELWWSSEACLVYKKHERPANCVSLHSIDYLILQVKIWSIKSFGFFEGIAVQPFCVMVISLCVCIYCPTVPGQHYRMMHGPLLCLWKPRFVWSGWIDWFVIDCCFLPWKMKMETSECVFPKKFGPLCLSY